MFQILGAKNRRKNLHKHPGPPFQIRGGPGSFSNAERLVLPLIPPNQYLQTKVHDFCNVLKSTKLQISTQISFGILFDILFFLAQSKTKR